MKKAGVYFERSKSSPINLSLRRHGGLFPSDPFFQIIPLALGRLKSLYIQGTKDNLQDITAHLHHLPPFLEELSVFGGYYLPIPLLSPTLFNGDLSSLRGLHLNSISTGLPWRNMANLSTFTLANTSSVSVRQLLDFFDSAPRIREVGIYSAVPTSGTQNGRLVSLSCLRKMDISGGPSSVLLGHLLIPVGAKLKTQRYIPGLSTEDHLPRSLDNLKNLSAFTKIRLSSRSPNAHIRFSGPNGQVEMVSEISQPAEACMLFESLTRFDTSKTIQLEIDHGDSPSSDHLTESSFP